MPQTEKQAQRHQSHVTRHAACLAIVLEGIAEPMYLPDIYGVLDSNYNVIT